MKTAKTPAKKAARKAAAKPVQRRGSPGATGNLSREEITSLLLQAQDAFKVQSALRRVEPGQSFDEWRREQVMDAAGVPGISKLQRAQWRTVKAHFLTLSGLDAEAFKLLNQTGLKTYRPASPADTWETSEAYVAHIRTALDEHAKVALTDPKGHIHPGWFLAAARQRTGKPTLILDTLAERLDPQTLAGLLAHLRNHIAKREGRGNLDRRAPRAYPKPADFEDGHPDPF